MNKTNIEWVKNPDGTQGYTWNPITGCLNGCPYCYARKLANGRLKPLYSANTDVAPLPKGSFINYGSHILTHLDITDPFYPRFWQSRLNEPLYGNPKGIFVCDMGELFGDWLPEGWANEVFHTINRSPQHRFYLLTHQPQNLIRFSPFPENCWVGITCTNALELYKALLEFERITASIKFISFEPLLSAMWQNQLADGFEIIDWVIIGAQTKPYKPPRIEWVREIVDACVKANTPVFLKNNLKPLIAEPGVVEEQEFELRQKMPDSLRSP